MDRDDPAYRGQAGYHPFVLAIYDPFVLGFMARVVWRCPTSPVVERYRQHIGRRHLDVGPAPATSSSKPGRRPGQGHPARSEPERACPLLPQAGSDAPDHHRGGRDEALAG